MVVFDRNDRSRMESKMVDSSDSNLRSMEMISNLRLYCQIAGSPFCLYLDI